MKNGKIRGFALIGIFFAAVIYLFFTSLTGKTLTSDSCQQIKDIEGNIYTDRADIDEFWQWLTKTVPKEDLCYVREEYKPPEGTEYGYIAYEKPDSIKGIDSVTVNDYSLYNMYVYVVGEKMYYNGVIYDLNEALKLNSKS